MSTTCEKVFTINLAEGDLSLDQAIYSPTQDKIFGVRGQWIYKFNASTGSKEAEFRYARGVLGQASIVELGGALYVGFSQNILWFYPSSTLNPQDIYGIDYALTASVPLGLDVAWGDYSGNDLISGYSNLVTDGTYIYGVDRYRAGIFRVAPSNVPGFVSNAVLNVAAVIFDVVLDTANGVLWAADWHSGEVDVTDSDPSVTDRANSTPGGMDGIAGLCYSPANIKVYAVRMNQTVIKANANEALPKNFLSNFTWSSSGNILSANANPIRIKYNPYDGLIYIPTWAGDTVEVFDPASDSIVAVKTGFKSPTDIVFTPTKKFAVQNSAVGLKEIT